MGCAVSTSGAARQSAGHPSKQPSFQSIGAGSSAGEGQAAVHPSAFLQYYNIASLCDKQVFGPYLKLQSYDHESGALSLSVLVVCTEGAQQACQGQLRITWWEAPAAEQGGPHRTGKAVSGAKAGPVTEGTETETAGDRPKSSTGKVQGERAAHSGRNRGTGGSGPSRTPGGSRSAPCSPSAGGPDGGKGTPASPRTGSPRGGKGGFSPLSIGSPAGGKGSPAGDKSSPSTPSRGGRKSAAGPPSADSPGNGQGALGTPSTNGPDGSEGTAGSPSTGIAGGRAGTAGSASTGPCNAARASERAHLEEQQRAAAANLPAGAATGSGELLYSWRDWRFWRFRIGVKCGQGPKRLYYQVSLVPGSPFAVSVPARDEPWRMLFYSCNGLDASHDHRFSENAAEAPALSLWRDVARRHAAQPFHVMIGGGDQLYNDCVFKGPLLQGWDASKDDRDTAAKAAIPFSEPIAREVEEFYFSHYAAHWSQPAYAELFASVPAFNVWDDHDIVDGWGSYEPVITDSAIMQGLFDRSRLFYLLFQQHTTLDRLAADGYWCEPASCSLHRLGASVALLAPDTRTCRTQQRVLPPGFLQQAQERLRALPSSVRHVLLLVGGPVVYPKLPLQDALQKLDDLFTGDTLVSVIMQKTGLAAKVTKRFGMVAYLDDIIDQWGSNQHATERDQLLETVMTVAQEKGVRVTLLSGDVHCAGYGMLHSRGDVEEADVPAMCVPSESARRADPRFIPQIISSAIVNVPPPAPLLKLLCLAGRCPQPILKDAVVRMMPLFGPEDDMDSLLMGKRNWCEATLGGPNGDLSFSLRCEREIGGDEVDVYQITVPPLRRVGS